LAAHFCRDHLLHPDPAKRSNSFFFFFFFFGFVHGRADLYRSMQLDCYGESREGNRYARFLKALWFRPPAAEFTNFWMRLSAAP